MRNRKGRDELKTKVGREDGELYYNEKKRKM